MPFLIPWTYRWACLCGSRVAAKVVLNIIITSPSNAAPVSLLSGVVLIQIIWRCIYVTVICDPLAGAGTLVGAAKLEDPPCNYNFEIRTLYGCPLCSYADFDFYYTACDNGARQKIYYWASDPPFCHDGITLPNPEQVPCSQSTFVCPAGQHIEGDIGMLYWCKYPFQNNGFGQEVRFV